MTLTIGSLFSGIGGLELGLERAGMETLWQVEYDDYCNLILEKHWSGVKRYGDIKEIKPGELEKVDVICGGFPCQPFSHAGKRRGTADERWLWPEFLRIVRDVRPGWVVIENVRGLLSIDAGRVFGGILRDLSDAGYDAEWRIVSAQMLGARHRRERIFIVAHTASVGSGTRRPEREGQHGGSAPIKPSNVADSEATERQQPPHTRSGWNGPANGGGVFGAGFDAILASLRSRNTGKGGIWYADPADAVPADPADFERATVDDSEGQRFGDGANCENIGATHGKIDSSSMPSSGRNVPDTASEQNHEVWRDCELGRDAVGRQEQAPQQNHGKADNNSTFGCGDVSNPASIRRAGDGAEEQRISPQSRIHGWGEGGVGKDWLQVDATQPGMGGVVDGLPYQMDYTPRVGSGIPDRVNRLKCLGNAVVPQVAEAVGMSIIQSERSRE